MSDKGYAMPFAILSLSLNFGKISKKQAAKMQQDAAAMSIPFSRSKKDAEKKNQNQKVAPFST